MPCFSQLNKKGQLPLGPLLAKQNIQAKDVYSQTEAPVKNSKNARKMCSTKTQQHWWQ